MTLFAAEIYPPLGEYLAERYQSGYDANTHRSLFQDWLTRHADDTRPDPIQNELAQVSEEAALTALDEAALAFRIAAGREAKAELAAAGHPPGPAARDGLERNIEDGREAADRLFEANLSLVMPLARRLRGRGVSLFDLVQEGNRGLTRAIGKFDPAKGYRFSTFATWFIRQEMARALARQPPPALGDRTSPRHSNRGSSVDLPLDPQS
jgi:DNA-directed RNA polymerase sigma subunit (sigma70/sigma32)